MNELKVYDQIVQIRCYEGKKQWQEVKQWCSQTLGPYVIEESGIWNLFLLYFADPRDLFLFRLRYGDLETWALPLYRKLPHPAQRRESDG